MEYWVGWGRRKVLHLKGVALKAATKPRWATSISFLNPRNPRDVIHVRVTESWGRILVIAEIWSCAWGVGNVYWLHLSMPWMFVCGVGQAFSLESCTMLRSDTHCCLILVKLHEIMRVDLEKTLCSLEIDCTEFCFCLWAVSDKKILTVILASAASPLTFKVYCRPRQLRLGSGGDGAHFANFHGDACFLKFCAWYEWPYVMSQLDEGGGWCLIV